MPDDGKDAPVLEIFHADPAIHGAEIETAAHREPFDLGVAYLTHSDAASSGGRFFPEGVLVIRSKQMKDIPTEWTDKQIASVIEVAVQFLLSLWLIFGSSGIRRIIYRFRYGAIGATEPKL